ncbi:hypothetical protein COOONC_14390 [Cooperia oncophora]
MVRDEELTSEACSEALNEGFHEADYGLITEMNFWDRSSLSTKEKVEEALRSFSTFQIDEVSFTITLQNEEIDKLAGV